MKSEGKTITIPSWLMIQTIGICLTTESRRNHDASREGRTER